MKILLSGSSGFLGGIIYHELKNENEVFTIGRNPEVDFQCDLTSSVPVLPKFELVIHAAGKAHAIPRSSEQEHEFFNVNVNGTLNLLNALEAHLPGTLIFISSVAVYGKESGENIDESFPLEATDAYGKSKIEAEKAVLKWGKSNNVNIIILRLPLIAGPNPPGNLGAMMKAIQNGYYFRVGKGEFRRSVVTATEIAKLLPQLISCNGVYNLVNQYHPKIAEIDSILAKVLNKKIRVLPYFLVKIVAFIGDYSQYIPINSIRLNKLTSSLTFSGKLAFDRLKWSPGNIHEDTFREFKSKLHS